VGKKLNRHLQIIGNKNIT